MELGTRNPELRTIALLPWGEVIEDFLDAINVPLRAFCEEMTGGWLFGYIEALKTAGVRTVVYCMSAAVDAPTRYVNAPTGAAFQVLPAPGSSRRRRRSRTEATRRRETAGPISRTLAAIASYRATPVRALADAIARDGCDAILCQEYESPRFDRCVAIGSRLGVPVFGTFQGGNWHASVLETLLRPRSMRRCDGLVIAPGTEIERVRRRYGVPAEKIAQIFNPVDLRLWSPVDRGEARRSLGIPPEARIVIWHGRIDIHRKGLDVLIDAWRRITATRAGRDIRLLLIGTGAEAEKFRRLLDEARLPRVHWRDEYLLDRAELIRHLSAADAYTLPSRHEGFAVAPLEAMACGLAVVAADAPGVPDVLPGGEASGGVVVPREDPAALAAALGRPIDDAGWCAALGAAGRRRVESHFSTEAVGRQLRDFLIQRGVASRSAGASANRLSR